MKTIKSICAAIFCCALVAGFSSCSNVEDPLPEPTPNEEGTTYEVSLNLGGEYTEVSEEPLGRSDEAAPKKYYGIKVYCMKTDGSEDTYSNYAYGLFDNKESMTISLLGGYKYKFICASYEDGEESLYVDEDGWTGRYPFNRSSVKNAFIITSKDSGFSLNEQVTTVECVKCFKDMVYPYESYATMPNMKILFGALVDFIPSQGAKATIPMYKIGFGLRIVINGVPDGELYVNPAPTPQYYYRYNYTTCESLEWSKTFTESGSIENMFTGGVPSVTTGSNWKNIILNYSKDSQINFTWTRANGYVQRFSKSVKLKRNVMTVLTVNLTGGASDMNIGIDEYAPEMTTEEDNVDYDGGDMNDSPINPEE